jgi:serine/threonine-protein kinase
MFLDEARIASRIEHFNVARIIDLGEEHDILYLVMEYVDGDSLSKLRRACTKNDTAIPPGVLLRILADACSGLHEAHELKDEEGRPLDIVHRDISPHNILVNTKGIAKVIDFGIAKARDRMAGETNAGVLKGKIQYMAPEQALGRKVDRRADLWAVGATLYHLLTGKPPYDADNTLGTLHLLTSGRPPLPLPPSVPAAIANIARKALTTAADARFQSAAQMRDAIEAAMYEAGVATTAADAAAFLNKQLADRTAKRRQVIDIALAAAAERQRVVEVLKPHAEKTGSGLTSSPPSERTIAEAPAALRGGTIPDGTPSASQGTPAGTVASDVIELPPPRRTGLVVALVGLGLAAAAGVAFFTLRPTSAAATRPPPPVPTASAGAATASASASAAPSSAIPEVSFSDLPRASASATSPPPTLPRQTWQAPRPPAPPPSPPTNPPPPTKKKIDDGF